MKILITGGEKGDRLIQVTV